MLPTRKSCQDPAGNRTTRRPPDHRKETQTAVVWSCLPFIRSGQKHLTRHSERGKKTRQTEEEVGRQHKGINGQAWSSPSPRGQWRTGKKWRKQVVKSSVVPQRPSQSRDRWDDERIYFICCDSVIVTRWYWLTDNKLVSLMSVPCVCSV